MQTGRRTEETRLIDGEGAIFTRLIEACKVIITALVDVGDVVFVAGAGNAGALADDFRCVAIAVLEDVGKVALVDLTHDCRVVIAVLRHKGNVGVIERTRHIKALLHIRGVAITVLNDGCGLIVRDIALQNRGCVIDTRLRHKGIAVRSALRDS